MMYKRLVGLFLILVAGQLSAQNTGGVFPPFVNPGFQSLQYRVAVDTDSLSDDTGLQHRIHYLDALNDDYQFVAFAGFNRTPQTEFDFNYIHIGLFRDLGVDGAKYRTGVRFDGRINEGARPDQIGLNWMHQYYFDNGWTARGVLLTALQLGDRAANGLSLQTRWQLAKRLQSGHGVGLEMFSFYGSTDNLGNFDSQIILSGPPTQCHWVEAGRCLRVRCLVCLNQHQILNCVSG